MLLGMWAKLQKLLDRIESRISLWLLAGGSTAMGVITGWISSYSAWLAQFGAIGWWMSGLMAAAVVSGSALAIANFRLSLMKHKALHTWKESFDTFNPMETSFSRLRLRLSDLADPIGNMIVGKTIANCDLLGSGLINRDNSSRLRR
jgi:hypothetical protein